MLAASAKKKNADVAFEYILERLQNLKETDSPLQQIACLFVMKESFAKHPMPSIAELCFQRDIISTLMKILEREFHRDDKTNETLLYSLTMELLWNFSSLEAKNLKPLISEPLLTLLARYTDVSHSFYQFHPALATKLHSLCCDTHFPCQKVTSVPMTTEMWQDVLRYVPDMAIIDPASSLNYCSITTTQVTNRTQRYTHSTITKQLISSGLAWSTAEPLDHCAQFSVKDISQLIFPEEEEDMLGSCRDQDKEEEGIVQDIFFLKSIGGPYFWAYLGTDVVSTVQSITGLLTKELPRLIRCRPHKEDLVAVIVQVEGGQKEVRRGRVVEVCRGLVQVQAVDYGSFHTVSPGQVFQITGSVAHLKKIDAQAKLCCLAGIQAPPVEEAAVELALCTFINLTKNFRNAVKIFKDAGGLNYLHTLICCAPATLKPQIVRLLANLTSVPCCRKVNLAPFIGILIEVLYCVTKKEDFDKQDRSVIISALFALINIMHNKPEYHNSFFDMQGQILVLNLIRRCITMVPVVRAASLLLKTVYPEILKAVPKDKNSSTENWPDKVTVVEKKSVGHRHNSSTSLDAAQDSSDDEINTIMKNQFPKTPTTQRDRGDGDSDGGRDSNSRLRVEPLVALSLPTDTYHKVPETVTGHAVVMPHTEETCPEDSREMCQSQDCQEMPASSVQFVPVDGGTIYDCLKNSDHFYEYNSFLPYRDDVTHHLWDADNIDCVSLEDLAQIVCGMLNVEGGTIFIGLSKTGCVRGLPLDRNTRDCVRLTLDRLNQQLEPTVSHNQIHLSYVEVGERALDGEMKHLHNRYVIEIIVKAPWELMFYCTGRPRVCYVRNHRTNTVLSEQDVRKLIVLDEERRYLPQIHQLRQRIEEMEKELAGK